jgi:hypothetical protein
MLKLMLKVCSSFVKFLNLRLYCQLKLRNFTKLEHTFNINFNIDFNVI